MQGKRPNRFNLEHTKSCPRILVPSDGTAPAAAHLSDAASHHRWNLGDGSLQRLGTGFRWPESSQLSGSVELVFRHQPVVMSVTGVASKFTGRRISAVG